jgi:hypothetical protein
MFQPYKGHPQEVHKQIIQRLKAKIENKNYKSIAKQLHPRSKKKKR